MGATLPSLTSVILPLILLTFTARGQVEQIWGDAAHPQWQGNNARNGLLSSGFDETELLVDILTLSDLADAPYNNEEVGVPQSHCPANLTRIEEHFNFFECGGMVQDENRNIYYTCASREINTTQRDYLTLTIKFSLTKNRYGVEWVTCTGFGTVDGDFYFAPALYKANDGDVYIIIRDYESTQFAIRASNGTRSHVMKSDNSSTFLRGNVLITTNGYVIQPGDLSDGVIMASTPDPLTGFNFTQTRVDINISSTFLRLFVAEAIQTLGSDNSFVATLTRLGSVDFDENFVSFYDSLGQTNPTTEYFQNLTKVNQTIYRITAVAGLTNGRVVVAYADFSLSIIDSDGSIATSIKASDGLSASVYPLYNGEIGVVAEGADGRVYMLTEDCDLVRVDISVASMEVLKLSGTNASCSFSYGLGANEDGVFFASHELVANETCIIRINMLRYDSSTINQVVQMFCDYAPMAGRFGTELRFQLMPGAFAVAPSMSLYDDISYGEGRLFFIGHWQIPDENSQGSQLRAVIPDLAAALLGLRED